MSDWEAENDEDPSTASPALTEWRPVTEAPPSAGRKQAGVEGPGRRGDGRQSGWRPAFAHQPWQAAAAPLEFRGQRSFRGGFGFRGRAGLPPLCFPVSNSFVGALIGSSVTSPAALTERVGLPHGLLGRRPGLAVQFLQAEGGGGI